MAAPAGRRRGERGAGGRRGPAGLPRRGLRLHGLARRPRRRAQRGRGRARLDGPLVDLDRRDRRGCALPCRRARPRASCPATACRARCSSPAGRSGSRKSPPTPPIAGSLPPSEVGLHAALAFPVLVGTEVVAVLEFYGEEPAPPDDSLLRVMANVGTVLGRVVERTRSERALAAQNEQLRQLDALKDEFVSLVSHELRTPLRLRSAATSSLIVEDGGQELSEEHPPVPRGRPSGTQSGCYRSRRRPALRRAARRGTPLGRARGTRPGRGSEVRVASAARARRARRTRP